MLHKQSYVAVLLNKRRYSCENAAFDMFPVIFTTQDYDTTR